MKTISLVIPLYNEELTVIATLDALEREIATLPYAWQIVLVNDGSQDTTLALINGYRPSVFSLKIVDLSRNFGKEAALSAGLVQAEGDAVIPFDADLQDPPSLIPRLIEKWQEGYDVVLAKRSDRSSDSALKRLTAQWFYRSINRLSDVAIPENVGDFRLMDRKVVDALGTLHENHRFMKGLFAWAGFRTCEIEYTRAQRHAGTSKFNGWKLWNLALEGITSFSTIPLRVWTYLGFGVSAIACCYGLFIAIRTLLYGNPVQGYTSLAVIILFSSGIQLTGIGILGEYIGRIYLESKRRPAYIVRSVQNIEQAPNPPATAHDSQEIDSRKHSL